MSLRRRRTIKIMKSTATEKEHQRMLQEMFIYSTIDYTYANIIRWAWFLF